MIERFSITNFRCFNRLEIEPLARINLVAGTNSSGKTSLLEALLLSVGADSARAVFFDNPLRDTKQLVSAHESLEDVFFAKKPGAIAEITLVDESEVRRQVTLTKEDTKSEGRGLTLAVEEVETDATMAPSTYRFGMDGSGGGSVLQGSPVAVFNSSVGRFDESTVQQFSDLEEVGRHTELLSALQILEPRLCKLAVLLKNRVPIIYGDIGIGRLIPLQLMGEGIARLTMFVLGIASVPAGMVLIDEIENGFHYSVLQRVWTALGISAERTNVQVFATTHSWECIRAAHLAFSETGAYDFRLHRLERAAKTGDVRAVTLDKDALSTAIETGFEVR